MTLTVVTTMAADPGARAALAGSTIYATSDQGRLPGPSLADLNVIPTMGFTSEAKLALDVQNNTIPKGIRAVLYDNEDWDLTPPAERLDPIRHYKEAAVLAHAHGLQFVATPGWLPGYRGVDTPGMTTRPSAAQIVPAIAASVDVVDIQAQKYAWESNLQDYLAWVAPIAKAARQNNPRAAILSGLSTRSMGGTPTAQQLAAIASGTEAVVNGWWLNVPLSPGGGPPQYSVGISFLRLLGSDLT